MAERRATISLYHMGNSKCECPFVDNLLCLTCGLILGYLGMQKSSRLVLQERQVFRYNDRTFVDLGETLLDALFTCLVDLLNLFTHSDPEELTPCQTLHVV